MPPARVSQDPPGPGDASLHRALRLAALDQAAPLFLGFGVVFALFGVYNGLLQPWPAGALLGVGNLAVAATCAGLGVVARRRRIPERYAHVPPLLVSLLAVGNIGLGLLLFATPFRVTFLMLTVLGMAMLTYSRAMLAVICAAATAAWGFGMWLHGATLDWITLGLGLLAAIGIAFVFHTLRVRAALRIEGFRHALAARNAELERALAETQAGRERFRLVVENISEIITTIGADGRVLDVSPAIRRVLGHDPADLQGRSAFERLHPEDAARVTAEFAQAVASPGVPISTRYRWRHEDGSWRVLETTGVNLLHVPGVGAVVCASRDVTERLQMEEEIVRNERLSSLGTLVAGVAHEINNPLMYMQGNAELLILELEDCLRDPKLPDPLRASLSSAIAQERTVLQGIGRIGDITRGLKRAAKATDGRRAEEDVNTVCTDVLALARSRFKDTLHVATQLRARRRVMANATELSQVILNLVLNAVEAMEEQGGGTLTVRTSDDGPNVVLEVEDTGQGIPAAQQGRLFTPFHTTKATGAGLGLSVSYRIVEGHSGRMTFRSREGHGTTFRIELPALAAPLMS